MSGKAISIKGLNFSYAPGRQVLFDVSFDIDEGESVGLIGPNGAGKTTLLLHLNGILRGSGDVFIKGKKIDSKNIYQVRKEVALVFQNPEIQLFMPTVYDDVAFGPLNMGYPGQAINEKVDDALEKINMLNVKNSLTHHLSFGEKKKISLATVLSMEPDILVLDEPSSNLDPFSRRNLINLLKGFSITKIIASHDLDLINQLCQRCILVSGGRVIADGDTKEILGDKKLLEENRLEALLLPERAENKNAR